MQTWTNNAIQFPRLLAEIAATQELDMKALAESMNLTVEQVNELFDRADTVWENVKEGNEPVITVDLNIYDDEGNVVDGTTADMTLAQVSSVVDHASQLILVHRSSKRHSGDMEPIIERLDEALYASDVIEARELES